MAGPKWRAKAVELDLLEGVLELVVQERRRTVRRARVVDHQADVQPRGRIGHPRGYIGIRQVLDNGARRHPVLLARPGGYLVEQRSVARDQHQIQTARG